MYHHLFYFLLSAHMLQYMHICHVLANSLKFYQYFNSFIYYSASSVIYFMYFRASE